MEISKDSIEQPREPVDFLHYRKFVDELTNEISGDAALPMPRIGVFEEDVYEEVIKDPKTVYVQGIPVVCSYSVAYPHFNQEKFPWLKDAGYSLVSVERVSELMNEGAEIPFDSIIGELVASNVVKSNNPAEIDFTNFKDTIDQATQSQFEQKVASLKDKYSSEAFSLLAGDGQPIIHHLIQVEAPAGLATYYVANIVDVYDDRDFVVSKSKEIADMHVTAFSEHSKSATTIELAKEDEVKESIENPNWYSAVHMDENGRANGVVYASTDPTETPWLSPDNSTFEDALTISVDGLSTEESARGEGVGTELAKKGINSIMLETLRRGKKYMDIVFDTSGYSTESVPFIVAAAIDMSNLKMSGWRVDVLANVVIKLK